MYHVYVSDRGNVFMTEIAMLLSLALGDLGYETVYPAPGLPEPGPGRINLVVAPHEFFVLQPDLSELELLSAAGCSVCIGVEQPGTDWFELGTHYASAGPAVLDISPYATAELERRGLNATHLQLGYHPALDRWGGDPGPRPTDLLFMGALTPRRERLLSEGANLLWDCHADIRVFEFQRPMKEARGNFVAGADKWKLLADSRILLNIHQGEAPYFEWMRVLEAVSNGCLVVSEASSDYGPLVPGEHLVAAPVDALAAYAASLIIDEPLRADMAASAYELVRTKLELTSFLEPICADLAPLAAGRSHGRHPLPFVPATPPPTVHNPVLVDALATELRARSRIKELYDSETQLLRHVEALQAQARFGDPDHAVIYRTPSWEHLQPEVTVLLTCYNYSEFVVEAIESVMAARSMATELVIIDDHSQDDSVSTVREMMNCHPSFPIELVARSANGGVARARNVGLGRARSELLFVLDADNTIYPSTLEKLARALTAQPDASFAYGIVPKSDGSGLLSQFPWDVQRLCKDNYIDAMAMIRRPVLSELGGYDEYFGLRGWEDYDLWLRVAAAGGRAEFVPEFIGTYRVHSTSRQTTVDLDTATLMSDFHRRYPYLPWN